jgi:hypothetical protein
VPCCGPPPADTRELRARTQKRQVEELQGPDADSGEITAARKPVGPPRHHAARGKNRLPPRAISIQDLLLDNAFEPENEHVQPCRVGSSVLSRTSRPADWQRIAGLRTKTAPSQDGPTCMRHCISTASSPKSGGKQHTHYANRTPAFLVKDVPALRYKVQRLLSSTTPTDRKIV